MSVSHLDDLAAVVADVVAPAADEVDRSGAFPRAAIDALGEAGLLGLISSPDVGGGGQGFSGAAPVIERLARECGSTAMVVLMHYAAIAIIEADGPMAIREAIAAGRYLTTLAFSEVGSRSHFWAPRRHGHGRRRRFRSARRPQELGDVGRARPTSTCGRAGRWRPTGPSPCGSCPPMRRGLTIAGPFDGLGLRGNEFAARRRRGRDRRPTTPCSAPTAPASTCAMVSALPWFLVLNAAFSLGLAEAVTAEPPPTSPAPASSTSTRRWPSRCPPSATWPACGSRPTAPAPSSPTPSPRSEPAVPTPCCGCSRSRRWPPRPRSPSPTWP